MHYDGLLEFRTTLPTLGRTLPSLLTTRRTVSDDHVWKVGNISWFTAGITIDHTMGHAAFSLGNEFIGQSRGS